MKLAEALRERADLNARVRRLTARLRASATAREGERTPEDPTALLAELNACADRLEELTARVNQTNARTLVNGVSVTEYIARRDALRARVSAYRALADEASGITRRAAAAGIKTFSAVDVPALQKEADAISKELRAIENTIQRQNWLTELL